MNKICVLFPVYNRLDYIRETLPALCNSNNLSSFDLHIIQDGPRSQSDEIKTTQVENYIQQFISSNVYFTPRPHNLGLGQNLIQSKFELFATYDKIIQIEEDIIVAPYAIDLISKLYDKHKKAHDTLVASISCFGSAPYPKKVAKLSKLINRVEWRFYCLDKPTWKKIKVEVAQYNQLFLHSHGNDIPYKTRDHRKIRRYFSDILGTNVGDAFPTGQDACMDILIKTNKIPIFTVAVNHSRDIGIRGEHTKSPKYISNIENTTLDLFNPEVLYKKLSIPL